MIRFVDHTAEDTIVGKLHKLDLQQGVVSIGNYCTRLPISPLEYREKHPSLAKIELTERKTQIKFLIQDDHGYSYTFTATGEDMENPMILKEVAICKALLRRPQMTEDRLIEIMNLPSGDWEGCNAMAGLNIIAKYLPKSGIEGAAHDVIFAAEIDDILEAGLTEEDAKQLSNLNWMIDESGTGLACFV